jgi:nucleolin
MNAKLFVRNLSWSVTENDLYDLFGEVGEVLSVKIPTRREDGKPRGFAFVEMGSTEAGQQVIRQFNGYMLQNRDLAVDFQDESRGGSSGASAPTPNAKLFVRNISNTVTEGTLQELFQQVGTVSSVKIVMDRDTGESKGFGFVEMGSSEEAQQAIQTLNNTYLSGKEIAIDFQDPNRSSKNKPRHGGGNYNRAGGGGGGYDRDRSSRYSNQW